MKALRQLEYAQSLQILDIPIPEAGPGTAVLRILGANIISFTREIYNGVRSMTNVLRFCMFADE